MFVLKIILFVAAVLFFFIGTTLKSDSNEELGIPFIILGLSAFIIAILLCFKLFLVAKIVLAVTAGLLLILGIIDMNEIEEEAGWFCIITAVVLALLSFLWFMNIIGGSSRLGAHGAGSSSEESRSSMQYVGVTGASMDEKTPKRQNEQWLFMKEE